MREKKRKNLLICLEVSSLAVLLPIFYWGTVKLVLAPIEDAYYTSRADPILPIWGVVVLILAVDAIWIVLMTLCPKDKIHIKVVLTLLFLTVSAAVLSGFVVIEALSKAFA
jgi:hypothetical protein